MQMVPVWTFSVTDILTTLMGHFLSVWLYCIDGIGTCSALYLLALIRLFIAKNIYYIFHKVQCQQNLHLHSLANICCKFYANWPIIIWIIDKNKWGCFFMKHPVEGTDDDEESLWGYQPSTMSNISNRHSNSPSKFLNTPPPPVHVETKWVSSFLTAHQHNIGYAVPYY